MDFPDPIPLGTGQTGETSNTNTVMGALVRAILEDVFELTISSSFSAAHALVIQGVREPVHGHDWQVEVLVGGVDLDEDGMLCDFHELEGRLAGIIAPFQTANLNDDPAFSSINPSAESVARHIGERFLIDLPAAVRLLRVSVTEAPGCKAAWIPDPGEGAVTS